MAAADTSTKVGCEAAGGTWKSFSVNDANNLNNLSLAGTCSGVPSTTPTTTGVLANASMADKAASFAYLGALRHCVAYSAANLDTDTGSQTNRLSEGAVKAGTWFKDDQYSKASYLSGVAGAENGDTRCNAVVSAASTLWGFGSPMELYCSFLPSDRVNKSSCETGSGPFRGNYGSTPFPSMDPSNALDTVIKNRIYGGSAAKASSEQLYLIYRAAFFGGCNPKESTNPADAYAYHVNIVNDDGTITPKTYEGVKFDTGRYVYTGSDLTELNESCRTIEARINEYASAYKTYRLANPTESTDPTSTTQKDCVKDPNGAGCEGTGSSCPVTGVGWIVCPVLNAMGGLNDAMWGFTSALLTVSPIQQEQRDADGVCTKKNDDGSCAKTIYYAVWRQLWGLSNVGFVIVFMVIIFAQLLGGANLNYGVKKALPRFIVAVIAASLSFFLIQLAVDIANVAGKGIYQILDGAIQASGVSNEPSWGAAITAWATGGLAFGAAAAAIAIAPEAALMLALPAALAALLGFLAALVTLIFRQAVIPILALVAPLAILAAILPNTKSWFDKWKSLFIAMLMLYPMAALLFGGVKIAAYIINADGSTWSTLIALIVMGAPLLMLPFIARKAGPMLGKINSTARGLMGRVEKPVKGWADSRKDRAIAAADARTPSRWNVGARVRQGFQGRAHRRELDTKAYQAQQTANFNSKLAEHADDWAGGVEGDAAQAYIRGAGARAEAEELKTAQAPLQQEIAAIRAGTHKDVVSGAVKKGDVDTFLENRAIDTTRSATEREVAIHQAAALGRDKVIRKLARNPGVDQQAVQRAITANGGGLAAKAPDLVKGDPSAAFGDVNGDQLASFSEDTARAHAEYLRDLYAQASAAGATAADRDAFNKAYGAYSSAVQDIQSNPTLQAKFSGDTGRKYVEVFTEPTGPAGFNAYKPSSIQLDGKVR